MPTPRILAALLALLPVSSSLHAASKTTWPAISPAELTETAPQLEPEAPAEILELNIEVNDKDFPYSRTVTEYVRYKIYQPDKVEEITRISGVNTTDSDEKTTLRARLTLPGGKTQEFGEEAIKERTLDKQADQAGLLGWLTKSDYEVKEKFLAVTGVEVGAILEYKIVRKIKDPERLGAYTLQREDLPVRQAMFFLRKCQDTDEWDSRVFALNQQGGKLTEDAKAQTVTVTAASLHSIVREPLVGPETDYALTIVTSNNPFNRYLIPRSGKVPTPKAVEAKLGPWASDATIWNWHDEDRGYATTRVKQLAAELTQGLTDPVAKARAIHNRVQALYQKHRRRPGPRPAERTEAESLDDIMDVEKKPEVIRYAIEFVWLAVGLYRSAGFECHTVLLPDRELFRFNPNFPSLQFLPNRAVAVKIGPEWRFSAPQEVNRLPFGLLPWAEEAQAGLLAQDRKQELIKVPSTGSTQSVITSTGQFTLSADGELTGEVSRTFTGHTAVELRGLLRKEQKTKREETAAAKFGMDAKVVDVKITKIDALDDADKPLLIAARIKWPGFATRTKDRLLLRPAVFRVDSTSPFTATKRVHPIHFPYRWQELDLVQIKVPDEFSPEAPTAPASSLTDILSQETKLSYDAVNHTLHGTRSFKSNVIELAPDYYAPLKAWYDQLASTDQHEVVFSRKKLGVTEEGGKATNQ